MASPSPPATGNDGDYRLPLNLKPTHYDLTFKTDLEGKLFWGYGIIDLLVKEDTKIITFNSAGLKYQQATILDHNGAEHIQASAVTEEKTERVSLHFSETFTKGNTIKLQVAWEGDLLKNMMGYYHSSAEHKGKQRIYSLTQFEPTAARRAFPAWDEPLLKAEYSITLISRDDTVNLSNMPATSEKAYIEGQSLDTKTSAAKLIAAYPFAKGDDKWKITTFDRSPPMSSYLVAFANGHFEHLESSYKSPLSGKTRPLRIYATADVIHQAQFALDIKAQVTPLYEEVFDVEYPLPKLDTLVAADFDAGAMENWGLITGRTSAFLFDAEKSDLAAKKRVAVVQSHEVAHMWFGDITTMSWWDALWLNEGFATLMGEVIILNKIFPEWRPHSEFINDHLERALQLDAQRSSHPIQVDCPDANQINQIFDALSYSKAASMLRMLSQYVGEEKFLKGVSIYLKDHLFANSEPVDLWNGISKATGLDVAKMMDNWTWKIGFPVLTVTESDGKLKIRQDRFLASGDVTEDENKTIWYIPLTVLTTDSTGKAVIDRKTVLESKEIEISVDTTKPFKLNAGTVGVYRVAYTPGRLAQLGEWAAQKGSVFSLEDRMGLVSDAIVLAKAGTGKTSGALNLIEKLHAEKEYLVWGSIGTNLSSLATVWWEQPEEVRGQLDAFLRYLWSPLVKELGYKYSKQDSTDTRQLRTLAITKAASAEDPAVLKELQSLFAYFQSTGDDSQIPSDLLRVVFSTAVKFGGRTEYETVLQVWRKPPTPTAKIAAVLALTASKDPVLTKETLQFLLDEVPLQDWMYIAVGLGQNTATRRDLAEFFKANFDEILKRFEGNFSLGNIVKAAFGSFSSAKDADEIEQFFKGKDVSKFNLALAQSLDSVRANAAWLERSKEDVATWLASFDKKQKSSL